MPQLDPTWFASQLFWLAVTFGCLYLVLARAVLPPLMGVMAGRKTAVEGDLRLAQELKDKAEQAKADYERTLAEARARSQKLIDEAVAGQKAGAEKAVRDMEAAAAAKVAEAEKRIGVRKAELIQQLVPTAGELASMIAEKITRKPAKPEHVAKLIGELAKPQGR